MTEQQVTRAKNGYVTYNDMFIRIADGLLDEYEVALKKIILFIQ